MMRLIVIAAVVTGACFWLMYLLQRVSELPWGRMRRFGRGRRDAACGGIADEVRMSLPEKIWQQCN